MRKFRITRPMLRCLGSGLIALDVIYPGDDDAKTFVSVGGSCGNVLSVLNAFNVEVMPVVELGYDRAGKMLLTALKQREFNLRFVQQTKDIGTPIIIQEFTIDRYGHHKHVFSFRCPDTGERLPRFKPTSLDHARVVARGLSNVDVYYSDRLSLSTQLLAKACRKRDALVFLEPSARFAHNQFLTIAPLAHVLKVSSELISRNSRILDAIWNPLQIITAGEKGLWYRIGLRAGVFGPWHRMTAHTVSNVADTSGSGDWSSAGVILSLLSSNWQKSIVQKNDVKDALRLGQWLAAENCKWIGAQGLLYTNALTKSIGPVVEKSLESPTSGIAIRTNKVRYSYLKGRPIDLTASA